MVWGDRLFLLSAVPIGAQGARRMSPEVGSSLETSIGSSSWRSTVAPDAWSGNGPPAKSALASPR